MTLIEQMEQWKKDLEELSVEKAKAEGRLEQALADLKAAGFDTVEAAKDELDRLVEKKAKLETEAVELMMQTGKQVQGEVMETAKKATSKATAKRS